MDNLTKKILGTVVSIRLKEGEDWQVIAHDMNKRFEVEWFDLVDLIWGQQEELGLF